MGSPITRVISKIENQDLIVSYDASTQNHQVLNTMGGAGMGEKTTKNIKKSLDKFFEKWEKIEKKQYYDYAWPQSGLTLSLVGVHRRKSNQP
jgi:hypothetical protein